MPLFDFTLKNLAQTIQFNQSLSWFWLTDGSYNICIHGKRLLSYHPATISDDDERANYFQRCEKDGLPPYEPDYYIVRLYEDILSEALPALCDNVSDLVHQFLLNPKAYQFATVDIWDTEPFEHIDDDAYWACSFPSIGYFGDGYMVMPVFRVWRYADEVYIYWNGNLKNEHGVSWFAETGEAVFVMSYQKFMDEVHDFHQRLMNAMSERIAQLEMLCHNQQPIYPRIDYGANSLEENWQRLLAEHEQRQQSLAEALTKANVSPFNSNWEQNNLAIGINLRQILLDNPYSIEIIRV